MDKEISRGALAALETGRYAGEVVLAESPEALAAAAAELAAEEVVGFDTETRPAFRPGESYLPSLFQAATARRVYLFPVQRVDCSAVLAPLLASSSVLKVGVSVADDLKKLKLVFPFDEAAVLDLG